MKKFISMVMAAAMVVSLVPATAFAANTATLNVVKAGEKTATEAAGWATRYAETDTEIQIKLGSVETQVGTSDTFKFELKFDNAELMGPSYECNIAARLLDASTDEYHNVTLVSKAADNKAGDKNLILTVAEPTVSVSGSSKVIDFDANDIIAVKACDLWAKMNKVSEGKTASVELKGDFGTSEAKVFAAVVGKELVAEVEDVVEVAEDEKVTLMADGEGITIKTKVGNMPKVTPEEDITLKLSKGFEFVYFAGTKAGTNCTTTWEDEDELFVEVSDVTKEIIVNNVEIVATTAKPGDVATITVYADDYASAKVEVAKVIDYAVIMELVDADEDVPVIWSGVNVANDGLTVDDSHKSLKVRIKETFPGAWNMNKAFTLSLPEGVYVADAEGTDNGVEADDVNNTFTGATGATADTNLETAFSDAYIKGEHEGFEFRKYAFNNTRIEDSTACHEMEFTLVLVADPGFVGDVTLTLEGAAVETQEVVIAKFAAPWTIKAEQNDVIIDYRYTEIPTAITVTEAEAGLWEEGLSFTFDVEEPTVINEMIVFEGDAAYTVDGDSDMEVEDTTGALSFEVTEESEEAAAVITIDGIELFMQRNIPAGAYDLTVAVANTEGGIYDNQLIFAPEIAAACATTHVTTGCKCVYEISDVTDYSDVAKEAFINVVTAGRDQSDSSFTTTVVVPVGETTMIAGETTITLDVPAYINANGYIMVPVRAVANALGIANDCVQWNQAAKTVIIMYGDRLITMTAGSSVIYVGGAPLPSTSSVEIVDGRAFLGLRDLANALGVKSIAWDPVAKVGTLNPKA